MRTPGWEPLVWRNRFVEEGDEDEIPISNMVQTFSHTLFCPFVRVMLEHLAFCLERPVCEQDWEKMRKHLTIL